MTRQPGREPWLADPDVTLYHGDVLTVLRELPAESVDCCVTSPPYWGLRSYLADGHDDKPLELGLEPTPEEYVTRMVEVFREVRRVLAAHGTVWLNLGDSYAGGGPNRASDKRATEMQDGDRSPPPGLKPKDLVGIPWRVAFALQADGWYLRSDIIWAKPNPMPESVTDRPTKAHEYVFLLSKQPRYFFDQEAVREAQQEGPMRWGGNGKYEGQALKAAALEGAERNPAGRNIRSVWEIATQPYPEAHFATFPEELARRCIAAGCPEQVCRVCGKARERIVDVERGNINRLRNVGGRTDGYTQVRRPPGASDADMSSKRETVGFTECQCSTSRDDGNERPEVRRSSFASSADSNYQPGVVLDPFMGSGTVAYVARKLGRHAVGIDLNESYLELAARRLQQQSLFAEASA